MRRHLTRPEVTKLQADLNALELQARVQASSKSKYHRKIWRRKLRVLTALSEAIWETSWVSEEKMDAQELQLRVEEITSDMQPITTFQRLPEHNGVVLTARILFHRAFRARVPTENS